MKKRWVNIMVAALVLGVIGIASPSMGLPSPVKVTASMVTPSTVRVKFDIQPGWHIYGPAPPSTGRPTQIIWDSIPPKTIKTQWPPTTPFEFQGTTGQGYQNSVIVTVNFSTPLPPTLRGTATWLACSDICIPQSTPISLKIHAGLSPDHLIIRALKILSAFGLAIMGGILLNLMPCVLPVISTKLSKLLTLDKSHRLASIGWFGCGIWVSMMIIVAIITVLRVAAVQVGWGFQLQSPSFVAVLILIFWLVGLNFVGVFDWGFGLTRLGGHSGSFAAGVLTTVAATPCTGPFMGTAIGFGLTQPWWVSLIVFSGLAIGIWMPQLLILVLPDLGRLLPKSGKWQSGIRLFFGFLVFATVIWLLSVLGNQVGTAGIIGILGGCWVISMGVTMLGITDRNWIRWVAIGLIGIGCVGGIWAVNHVHSIIQSPPQEVNSGWIPFSYQAIASAKRTGRPILINATAKWCLTCQLNDRLVLSNLPLLRELASANVILIEADWTTENPEITRWLAQWGRSGVPLTVVIHPDGTTTILPAILTVRQVRQAIAATGVDQTG